MKKIAIFSLGIVLTACATTNATSTSSTTGSTKKEAVVKGNDTTKDLPATKHPNSAEPDNTAPAPYKQGDLRTY